MPLTVAELARLCSATLQGGQPDRLVRAAANLKDAGPEELAPLTDPRYADLLPQTRAAAVVLKTGLAHPPPPPATALLYADDPEWAFIQAVLALHPAPAEAPGVDQRACVEPGAVLQSGVYVGPFAIVRAGAAIGEGSWVLGHAYIGRNCRLGRNCRVYPHAVLYDGVELGDETIIHAGTVLGADGFGYKFRQGQHVKVPQVGTVRVGARVEIGANSAVDRASLGATSIGEGAKIDNLVQVGHNARVGRHVILCGQAGLAGSTEVQDYAVLGANAGVADHLTIGQGAKVGAKSGVAQNVPPGGEVFGLPASERRHAWRQVAALRRLPELLERVRELEKRLEDLEGRAEGK